MPLAVRCISVYRGSAIFDDKKGIKTKTVANKKLKNPEVCNFEHNFDYISMDFATSEAFMVKIMIFCGHDFKDFGELFDRIQDLVLRAVLP